MNGGIIKIATFQRKKTIKERIVTIIKKYHLNYFIIISFVSTTLVIFYSSWGWLDPHLLEASDLVNILSTLVKASSIIVSIIIGFLVTKFFDIKKFRYDMLNRFADLQERLTDYQKAFEQLADQLNRKSDIDPKYETDYYELRKNLDFWKDEKNKPYGSMFVRSLRESGLYSWKFTDYESYGQIMTKPYLLHVNECITDLNATLSRRKHYGPVLSDLGLSGDDFSSIQIADESLFVNHFAMRISPENEKESWRTLDFWYNRILEATDITSKMLRLSSFIHDYKGETIKKPLIFLIFASVFGIFLPIITLSLNFNSSFEYVVTYLSITGFLICFVVILYILYKEITSKTILEL